MILLTYDQAIAFLDIYSREMKIYHTKACMSMQQHMQVSDGADCGPSTPWDTAQHQNEQSVDKCNNLDASLENSVEQK